MQKEPLKFAQVDEEEAHGASQLGLTVFRDSVYESNRTSTKLSKKLKRKKNLKSNLNKLVQKTYDGTDSDSDYLEECSDSSSNSLSSKLSKRKGQLNQVDFEKNSDDDNTIDPDFNFRDQISDSESNDSFNFKDIQKTSKKVKLSFNKPLISPNMKTVNKRPVKYFKYKNCDSRLNKLNSSQEIQRINNMIGKRKLGRNYFLVPVVRKYESADEMKQRHRLILERAKKRYEKIVNIVKEEENMMELEIMSLELRNPKLSPSPKRLVDSSDENKNDDIRKFSYLCPFQHCSMPLHNPRKHLHEHHKMITDVKDIKLYINATKKIKYFKKYEKIK
ncbi:hypothetical protein Avbf_07015 [Armadillidium vulgare]|nr:hypothetical protein Avbf_07015 [Armadillidium vulgare]